MEMKVRSSIRNERRSDLQNRLDMQNLNASPGSLLSCTQDSHLSIVLFIDYSLTTIHVGPSFAHMSSAGSSLGHVIGQGFSTPQTVIIEGRGR